MPCHRARCDEACLPSPAVGRGTAGTRARRFALAGALLAGASASVMVSVGGRHGRADRGARWLSLSARLLLRALGIRLEQRNVPPPGAALVVSNHVSWLDALVLAGAARTVPVATSEVAGWPLVGKLAARCGAIFVDRSRRALPATVQQITGALRRGRRVQVFPEGTTRCGDGLDPFRPAAFRAAVDAAVPVAPAAISYADAEGRRRAECAFVGEMTLLDSVRRIVRMPPVVAEVRWLPAIPAVSTGRPALDRAMAARRAEQAVAWALGVPVIRRVPVPAAARLPTVPAPEASARPPRVAVRRVA